MELKNEIFVSAYDWLCEHMGVTGQKDLAQKTGIGENTVSNIMKGKTKVSDSTLRKLNTAFGNIFNWNWLRGIDPYNMLVEDLAHSKAKNSGKYQFFENQNLSIGMVADNPQPILPSWADTFITLLSRQIKENESLNQELRRTISEVASLRDDLRKIISKK